VKKLIALLIVLATPRLAFACPVCFGESDSPMAWATNLGILFMLAITVGMLAAFASFFIHLIRRARLVADTAQDAGTTQEGTARC